MHLLAAPGVVHSTNHIDKTVHLNNGHPVVVTNIIPADRSEPISALDTADAIRLTVANAIETTTAADVVGATTDVIAARIETANAADIADAVGVFSAGAIEAAGAGQVGAATAMLKGLSVASAGAVGTRGSGFGMIMKFKATASGRHDDDEAVMMAFLLAA